MSELYGRWDLTVGEGESSFPSWLELGAEESRFVGRVGSARPVPRVAIDGTRLQFSLPRQYEDRTTDLEFEGSLIDGELVGTTMLDHGEPSIWRGRRAPDLERSREPEWGRPVQLVGDSLGNWVPRTPNWQNHWRIVQGVLVNEAVGTDLVSVDRFMDFRLVAEYKYPAGSNSGIYLRGRYEFQILDDYGRTPSVGSSGAIYGFLVPRVNAVRPPDEWNVAEITLVGRRVTVVLNGVTILEDEEIPGITGGALDSSEGEPGPLFVQGDHGPVMFRRLELTPALMAGAH